MALLSLPQTDGPEDDLPQGAERSEKFVDVANEYFERLDVRGPSLHTLACIPTQAAEFAGNPHCHPLLARSHQTVPYRALCNQCASLELHPASAGGWSALC